MNISRATTKRELCKVQGVTEYTQRMQGINLASNCWVNALEYGQYMFKLPTLEQMLAEYEKQQAVVTV